MRRLAPFAVLVVLLAGCGGSGTPATTTEATTASEASTETATDNGPVGTLESDGIGDAKQGMTSEEVIGMFGEPETDEVIPGCELDTSAHELHNLIYDSNDGTVGILFDKPTDELQSYHVDESTLQTAEGIRVGDDFAAHKAAYGDELIPYDLGIPSTEKDGPWYIDDGPKQRLTFDIIKGKIDQILGGYTPACE
jgi:hypothetical protein